MDGMANRDAVSVIVPTMADAARRATLDRALDSLRNQHGGPPQTIVVANGDRADPAVLAALAARADIRLIRRAEGHLPRALAAGRELVETPYFGVLDDDDAYLPEALSVRRAPLDADPGVDVVATAGLVATERGDAPWSADIESIAGDPLGGLAAANWLNSCGALFRTARVPAAMLRDMPQYLEWTYLAARLSLSHRIVMVGRPTFRLDKSTAGSLSKSAASALVGVRSLETILSLDLPPHGRRIFRRKLVAALHAAAETALAEGDHAAAWAYHLRCVALPGGTRYVSYTRHLAAAMARRWRAPARPRVP